MEASDEQIKAMCRARFGASLGGGAELWDRMSAGAMAADMAAMRAALATLPEPASAHEPDTEDPSGYTITDVDKWFAHDLGFVAPEVLPLHVARFRTQVLEADRRQRQAASTPDRLPVPGAAVRALVAKWRGDADRGVIGGHTGPLLAGELEAALRADAAEMPTREEIARGLYEASVAGRPARYAAWSQLPNEIRDAVRAEADYVLTLLARRPATDEAARNYGLLAGRYQEELRVKDERIADLESQLASVTGERDHEFKRANSLADLHRLADDALSHANAAGMRAERERDEALAKLVNAEAEADHHARVREDMRQLLEARPEPVVIDEALARRVVDLYGSTHTSSRPLEQTMGLALQATLGASVSVPQGDGCRDRDVARAMDVLTSASIPTNRPDGSFMNLPKRVQALAEDRDQLRAELEECRGRLDLMTQDWQGRKADCDALRAELEKTRDELEALRAGVASVLPGGGGLFTMAEPERLAASGWHDTAYAIDYLGGILKPARVRKADGTPWIDPDSALLKPAPAEAKRSAWDDFADGIDADIQAHFSRPAPAWRHISSDGDSHTFRHGETGRRTTLEGFDTWQDAARHLNEPPQYHPNDLDDVDGDVSQLDEPGRTVPAEAEPNWENASPADALRPNDRHAQKPVQHPPHESAMVEPDEADQCERCDGSGSVTEWHGRADCPRCDATGDEPVARAGDAALWAFVREVYLSAAHGTGGSALKRIQVAAGAALDARKGGA